MNQPDAQHYPQSGTPPAALPALLALPALPAVGWLAAPGGLGFAVASIAGDLAIGAFPGPDAPAAGIAVLFARPTRQALSPTTYTATRKEVRHA